MVKQTNTFFSETEEMAAPTVMNRLTWFIKTLGISQDPTSNHFNFPSCMQTVNKSEIFFKLSVVKILH